MATDVWLRRDIANALMAAYQAHQGTASAVSDGSERSAGYHNGYRDAIGAIALFVGISPSLICGDELRPERADIRIAPDTRLARR